MCRGIIRLEANSLLELLAGLRDSARNTQLLTEGIVSFPIGWIKTDGIAEIHDGVGIMTKLRESFADMVVNPIIVRRELTLAFVLGEGKFGLSLEGRDGAQFEPAFCKVRTQAQSAQERGLRVGELALPPKQSALLRPGYMA